jgi:hypothetical protein
MLHYSFNADFREVLRRLATAAQNDNSQNCQGRSETRPLWRSKSRPVGRCWVVVRLSGEKGRWSVAEAALLPRGTFGGVRFSVRRTESVCGGSA